MSKQVTTFEVEGNGVFPLDMLRYDSCWPVSGDDVAKIEDRSRQRAQRGELVRIKLHTASSSGPTEGRWLSFGWAIVKPRHA